MHQSALVLCTSFVILCFRSLQRCYHHHPAGGKGYQPERLSLPPQGCENIAVSSRNKICNPKMRKRKKMMQMMQMKAPVMMTAGLMPLVVLWLVFCIFHQGTMAVIRCITVKVQPTVQRVTKKQLWVYIAGEISHQHFERPAATCRVRGSSLVWTRSCHYWTLFWHIFQLDHMNGNV